MIYTAASYTLTLDERPDYLYAHVRAETIDRYSAMEYLRTIAERRKSTRLRRLMLVREIPVMLPDSDLFFTTRDFNEMIGPTRLAVVNPFATNDDGLGFAMTIAANRGADYRVFSSVDRAEVWLRKGLSGS